MKTILKDLFTDIWFVYGLSVFLIATIITKLHKNEYSLSIMGIYFVLLIYYLGEKHKLHIKYINLILNKK